MRALLLLVVVAACVCAFNWREAEHRVDATAAGLLADVNELQRQVDHEVSAHDATMKSAIASRTKLNAGVADLEKRLNAELARCDTLVKAAKDITEQRDIALVQRADVERKLADAEAKMKAAEKAALKVSHDSCDPPEKVADTKQPQTMAPYKVTDSGKRTWCTDYDYALTTAKKLNRKLYLVLSTESCPHCQIAMDALSDQDNAEAIFKEFMPCWVTIVDKDTEALGRKYGVYGKQKNGRPFGCPCGVLLDPETGDWMKFRPTEDVKKVIGQLETMKGQL